MDRLVKSFCLDCEWTARTDTVDDRTQALVDHHVSTGHEIESVWAPAVVQDTSADHSKLSD